MTSSYNATCEWLFTQLPMFQRVGASAYKPGLDTARQLAQMFGNPHTKMPTIHIAGTNGKGSTSSTLAAILTAAGLRTGLYTSPHLVDFRERIRIDGRMIPEDAVIDFVERYRREAPDGLHPSFFELATIMAFDYFASEHVDVAVIETGLGGRLDTTNIITPDLAVITNISLDHTALLGNTRQQIASEKAGIIKPGVPVVIGESDDEVGPVFEAAAAKAGAPIIFAEEHAPIVGCTDDGEAMIYRTTTHGQLRGQLRGECQRINAATILTAVDMLNGSCHYHLSDEAIARGLGNVQELSGLTGRWTKVAENPTVICDTGHNIGGWEHIVNDLNATVGPKVIVVGFVNDKDVTAILRALTRVRDARLIFTQASVERALDATELCRRAAAEGLEGTAVANVKAAVSEAVEIARQTGATVFVGGSNFVVGDFLRN